MDLYKSEELCCGCFACQAVCPKSAVEKKTDEKGFLVPQINDDLCVNCGLCAKVCPLQNQTKENHKPQLSVYAGMHKDNNIRKHSRSGGVFMAVAEWVIAKGGIVYGAAFSDDLSVRHTSAESFEECKVFQGSKYVQSDLKNTFSEAAENLKNGRYVLFSGTGCQIDGFLRFLKSKKISTDKLVTCDIVCHGTPSPKLYEDYRRLNEEKYHGKITEFDFRDKSVGWSAHVESFVINGKKYMKRGYTEIFYSHAGFRASCYVCPYADRDRVGDFTLADCWGARDKLSDIYDNAGISLVLINSQKAAAIMDEISGKFTLREVSLDDFMQPQLRHPAKKNPKYEQFWDIYLNKDNGLNSVLKTFGKQNPYDNSKRWISRNILRPLKGGVKKAIVKVYPDFRK